MQHIVSSGTSYVVGPGQTDTGDIVYSTGILYVDLTASALATSVYQGGSLQDLGGFDSGTILSGGNCVCLEGSLG